MQTNMDFPYLAGYQTLEMKKTVLLSSDKTKAKIHQDYIKLADEMSLRKISLLVTYSFLSIIKRNTLTQASKNSRKPYMFPLAALLRSPIEI